MRALLILMAALEGGTGLALLVAPAAVVFALLGDTLETPGSRVVARVAGAALVALGLGCFQARQEPTSSAAAGVVGGMLLYNATVALLMAYAGLRLGLFGAGLWPGAAMHVALAAWCVACLRTSRADD
jgi:hypothetical protein